MPSILTATTRPHHRLHDSPKTARGHRVPSPTTISGLTPTSAACTSPHFVPYFHCNRTVLRFVEAVGREGDASDAEALSHVCLCLCFRGWREERFGETSDAPDGAVLWWYAFLAASDQIYGGKRVRKRTMYAVMSSHRGRVYPRHGRSRSVQSSGALRTHLRLSFVKFFWCLTIRTSAVRRGDGCPPRRYGSHVLGGF